MNRGACSAQGSKSRPGACPQLVMGPLWSWHLPAPSAASASRVEQIHCSRPADDLVFLNHVWSVAVSVFACGEALPFPFLDTYLGVGDGCRNPLVSKIRTGMTRVWLSEDGSGL